MKRIRIIALALVLMAILLCGCDKNTDAKAKNSRFLCEHSETVGNTSITYAIVIRDTETGRAYLFIKSGYGGGLTLMPED